MDDSGPHLFGLLLFDFTAGASAHHLLTRRNPLKFVAFRTQPSLATEIVLYSFD
jgi:hypothetical protein